MSKIQKICFPRGLLSQNVVKKLSTSANFSAYNSMTPTWFPAMKGIKNIKLLKDILETLDLRLATLVLWYALRKTTPPCLAEALKQKQDKAATESNNKLLSGVSNHNIPAAVVKKALEIVDEEDDADAAIKKLESATAPFTGVSNKNAGKNFEETMCEVLKKYFNWPFFHFFSNVAVKPIRGKRLPKNIKAEFDGLICMEEDGKLIVLAVVEAKCTASGCLKDVPKLKKGIEFAVSGNAEFFKGEKKIDIIFQQGVESLYFTGSNSEETLKLLVNKATLFARNTSSDFYIGDDGNLYTYIMIPTEECVCKTVDNILNVCDIGLYSILPAT